MNSWGPPAMPPVKTVASSTDVDNDATAELPVLDVAAYEATIAESIASTDTWTVPAVPPAPVLDSEAPQALVDVDSIPTLRVAEPEAALDLSGTHEMPQPASPNKVGANKLIKATPVTPPALGTSPVPVTLPPSPPLIEEL